MEEPTTPASNTPSAKPALPSKHLVTIVILIGFLAAAITYRIATITDLTQSRGVLERYEELVGGRDYASLMGDRRILNRINAQSLHDSGKMPTPAEVESKVEELAQAGELAGELDEQRARFTFFIDVIIYGLAGIIILFLAVLLFKRRHSYLR